MSQIKKAEELIISELNSGCLPAKIDLFVGKVRVKLGMTKRKGRIENFGN